MRWLVFFLLVLNAVFFTWFYVQQDSLGQPEVKHKTAHSLKGVPGLTLLEDIPESELTGVSESAEIEVEEGAADGVCVTIGPYSEMVSAKQGRSRLIKKGAEASVVVMEKILPPIHWVYIKPSADRTAALAILKRLQKSKIDSFLIAEGEYQYAISLGFFSKPESAAKILKARKAEGYDAAVTEKERSQEQYWVAVDAGFAEKITDNLLSELKKDSPDVKKQENSCEDVALLKIIE